MSENFWEQRKLEFEQTRQAELEKKAAEQKEKKKSQVGASTEQKEKKKKEKQPKVEQQKEQQPNGAATEQKEKKKKNFKKNKEATSSQPATTEAATTQDDFQTVERKTGGRRQFRGAKRNNNKKKNENGEKKKENKELKENKEQTNTKKEEKPTTEQTQQVVVQPVQIKVFSTTESAPIQGSDSWVSLLRGNQPETTTTTTTQQVASSSTNGTTKKNKPKSEKKTVVAKPTTTAATTETKKPQKNYEAGKNLLRSTEIDVDQALLDEVGVFIQPRGMTNINNSCYMNAVLQTLVSLPQFYHVMKKLGKISLDNEEYPLTNKFVRLVNEYQTMKTHRPQSGKEGEKKERKYFINASTEALVPNYIVDYIQQSSTNLEDAFLLGTQHDAHEFLNHILQRLHEELKKTETSLGRKSPSASKKKSKKTEETSEQSSEQPTETTSEEWKEVGKKNKSNPMREHEMGDSSVVSRTFAGKMKSFVQKQGESKGSSVVEPFFSLHLPIKDENIKGVKFALREMTKEENVSDKNAKSSIYQLPKVLLLHLRRFDFSSTEGIQKISKRIRFDYELNIDEKVVPNIKAISGRPNLKYRLASVVCHHGKDATSGHYSTYIQHGCGKWIHIDDTRVTVVSLQHVLDQQAYILTYVQDDNQEHYKLFSEGSSSSPLFSESSEQNGEKKKDHKKKDKKDKKDKKEKKEKKSNTVATTTTTPTTTTETKTEAKTDV